MRHLRNSISSPRRWKRAVTLIAVPALAAGTLAVATSATVSAADVTASAVLGDPPTFDGMAGRPGDGNRDVTQATTEHQGRSCWNAEHDLGNDFLYFGVDDDRIADDATAAFVTVEYFDAGEGNFTIHYDGENSAFTKADTVELVGDNTWKSYEFALGDIRFEDRGNGHDFRIANWDASFGRSPTPVCVGAIEVAFGEILPDLEIEQHAPGNVFVQPDEPAVTVVTGGDSLSWQVYDYWGDQVTSGTEPGGEVTLSDLVDAVGYYRLVVTAERNGSVLATRETDLALLSPFDVAEYDESPFGTVAHATREDTFDLIPLAAAAGAKTIREDASWGSIENGEPGEYQFSRYDPLQSELAEHGLAFLPIADYTNSLYDGNATPYTDEGRAGYANYAAAVADHYRGQLEAFEIYNEFNIGFGSRGNSPANSQPDYYFELLKAAYEEIRATDPDLPIVGGVTSSVPLDWLEELFSLGGLEYMDVLSVHPYTYPAEPEELESLLTGLDELVMEYNDDEPIPIWITEMGYTTFASALGVSEATQAKYLVRSHVGAFAHGVEKLVWYNLANTSNNPTNTNGNFGMMRSATDSAGRYVPKPGYVTYSAMTRQLTGATYDRAEDVGDGVESHVFSTADEDVRVLWSDEPATVAVKTDLPITVTDLMGVSQTYQPHAGRVYLSVSGDPLYLTGTNVKVSASEKVTLTADRDATVVGDSVELTLAIDNTTTPRAPMVGTLEIGGESVPVSVRPGEQADIAVTLPAPDQLGEHAYVGELVLHDRPSARVATSASVTEPVEVTSQHVLEDGAHMLSVSVSNLADRDLPVGGLEWTIAELGGTESLPSPLPAESTHTVTLPLAGLPVGGNDRELRVSVPGYSDVVSTGTVVIREAESMVGVAEKTITVDGVLDDLTDVPGIDIISDGSMGGPWNRGVDEWAYDGDEDFSGEIWPTWDDEYFYLSARIQDDIHHQREPRFTYWMGDSLQFSVNAGMSAEERPERFYDYRAVLTSDGPRLYRGITTEKLPLDFVSDVDMEVVRDEATGETVYELAIPWDQLAPPVEAEDGLLSLSLQPQDNDGLGRKGWVTWSTKPIQLDPAP